MVSFSSFELNSYMSYYEVRDLKELRFFGASIRSQNRSHEEKNDFRF